LLLGPVTQRGQPGQSLIGKDRIRSDHPNILEKIPRTWKHARISFFVAEGISAALFVGSSCFNIRFFLLFFVVLMSHFADIAVIGRVAGFWLWANQGDFRNRSQQHGFRGSPSCIEGISRTKL